jgi:hypothetical protein
MKLPREVKMGYRVYRLVETKAICDDGLCQPARALISIQEELPNDLKADTLCHELIHMILYEYGLSAELDDKTEEAVAQVVGRGLTQIFARSPSVIRYIQRLLKKDEKHV